jgi:hypothetical protein
MLELNTQQIEVFGKTVEVKRSDAVMQRPSVDALRHRLLRAEGGRNGGLFVFEEIAPPLPFFLEGVQKGWTPQPSKYRLYQVNASLRGCIELAVALGFCPDSCSLQGKELRDKVCTLIAGLDSHEHLVLTQASQSFMILEVATGQQLSESDARAVLDFDLHQLGAKLQEVSYATYVQHFLERGFVVIGTTL